MSHREKLEQVLDLLINEEQEKAEELLHQIMVEKARAIYESILEDDMKGDFADEIEADIDEIESDEEGDLVDGEMDMEVDAEADMDVEDEDEDEDEDVEDRVEDLETELANLRAEFDMLMGEMGAEDMDAEEGEFMEATKLQNPVTVSMSKEGQLAGTGKNSKVGATGTEAPYTHAPKKDVSKAGATDFAGGDEKGQEAKAAKDHTPTSNVDVTQAPVGKVKDKEAGDVGTDSLLAN